MAVQKLFPVLFLQLALAFLLAGLTNAGGLQLGFYRRACPDAELIVHQTLYRYISRDRTLAAPLLRMHFHDCFIRGCDGSVLLSSTKKNQAEKDAIPNQTLRGLYNFTGKGDTDPSLDPRYAAQLKKKCKPGNSNTVVEMDPALLDDAETRDYVRFQSRTQGSTFAQDFGESMVKMGYIGVLTGKQGEIRKRHDYMQEEHPSNLSNSSTGIYIVLQQVQFGRTFLQLTYLSGNDAKTMSQIRFTQPPLGTWTLLIFTPDMVTALNLTVGLSDQDVRSKNAITCRLGLEVVETCTGELSIGTTSVLSACAEACAPIHARTPTCVPHNLILEVQLQNFTQGKMAIQKLFVVCFLQLVFAFLLAGLTNAGGLQLGFYRRACPDAELIVHQTLYRYISRDRTLAAPLLRMHFHDCFIRCIYLEYVLVTGGHTIGIGHCTLISNRLYNFTGKGDTDPSLDPRYAAQLKKKCKPGNSNTVVEMDPGSFKSFDEDYYTIVAKRRGLFQSDSALLDDAETRDYVRFQSRTQGSTFAQDFGESMVKMGYIGVLTGKQGEIRKRCAVVN
ncbi:hypothetical protein D5086_014189 [Populus alba]|uniref:Uncharacterized protein n=1 Tax=Populus alba TaxID=43335 RepID=A0ACC4BZJ5_POPAL